MTLPLMVFTDLDGTLLDHDTYDWTPAKPAIELLRLKNAALVLASSKTAAEIIVLRNALEMQQWPAIVENGAGLLPAGSTVTNLDDDYQQLRETITRLPESLSQYFCGFGDMTDAEVADATGLNPVSAILARKRSFSEPGIWSGDVQAKAEFLAALEQQGISAIQGGRFLTLSFGANKADQLRRLVQQYQPEVTIALGDAPNDIGMLEAADYAVVVSNPHGNRLPPLAHEHSGRVFRTKHSGPAGWNVTMLDLIEQLTDSGIL